MNKRRLFNIVGILVLVGIATFASVNMIKRCMQAAGQQDAIDGGVIVEAELVRIDFLSRYPNTWYYATYEYVDENGIKYSGRGLELGKISRQEAERYIGGKVEIFIDGKGHSITVGWKPDFATPIVFSIVLPIVIITGPLSVVALWRYRAKKTKQRQEKMAELEERGRILEEESENKKQKNTNKNKTE